MVAKSLQSFNDILLDRRNTSDVVWMTRRWDPIAAYRHVCKTDPAKMKRDVLNSPRLQLVIDELSHEQNVPKEVLYKTVHSILEEVGQKRDVAIIRWLGLFVVTMFKRSCAAIYVNEDQIKKIKALMGTNPVIFAPSHRSYIDFMLMSYICFHYDIQIPAIAAGMDFHAMWMVGQLMREACAFFMRRSFGVDRLYSATFKEYVSHLVTDGDSALEFYIEGTRSRSAKSLMPKFGFLSMALAPFISGYVPDVTIVPWNISYDRTPEEVLFAYELLGVPKPKESTSGLIKALKILDERYGNIYVDVGDPISARDFLGPGLSRASHSRDPPCVAPRLSPDETALCAGLAHEVVRRQQLLATLTAFNLVAVVITNGVVMAERPVALQALLGEMAWLKSVVESLGARVDMPDDADGVRASVQEALLVHKALVTVTAASTLQLARGQPTSQALDPAKLRGHSLLPETMSVALPMLMLQHYVNPCMHYLIGPATITVIMQHLDATREINKDDLFNKYRFVRAILSHEFVLYSARENQDFEESVAQLDLLNIAEAAGSDGGRLALGNHRKLQLLLCNLLLPFLQGYLVVGQVLTEVAVSPCSEKHLLPLIQKAVEQQLTSGQLRHAASLSLDMYSAALQSFVGLHALSKTSANGQVLYQMNSEPLQEIISTLALLVTPPREMPKADPFDVKNWLVHEERAKL